MLAITYLERMKFKMVGMEVKFDLPHPHSIINWCILVFEGNVEENGRFDKLSIPRVSNIKVKINRIFCKRIYTDRE